MNNPKLEYVDHIKRIIESPRTIDEAVTRLLEILTEVEKENIRMMQKDDLVLLQFDLGKAIRKAFVLNNENLELMVSCNSIDTQECSMKIIEGLWIQLNFNSRDVS
jgi:hypothetical protein